MNDSGNPYLPPKAVVADASDESPRARPVAVTVALFLIGARLLLGLGVLVQSMLAIRESPPMSMIVMATLSVAVTFALGCFIARGRNWARIVYMVMTIFALAALLLAVLNMLSPPQGVTLRTDLSPRWVVMALVPQLLSIAVVVLLFGPGRSWFRPRS